MTSPPPPGTPLDPDVLYTAATTFGLLAATARLQIVWLLAAGERDVTTLAAELDQSVAAVSQHLAKLKLAGLVQARRVGRRQVYLIDDPQVIDLVRRAVQPEDHRPSRRARTGRSSTA